MPRTTTPTKTEEETSTPTQTKFCKTRRCMNTASGKLTKDDMEWDFCDPCIRTILRNLVLTR